MFLSDASLKKPVAMSVVILALVVLGLSAYFGLGLEFLPSVDVPTVTVVTAYPGAGPKEVETLVTEIIEDAVSEVNGIDSLKSISMENVSQIVIQFDMDIDVNFAAIDVKEKVDAIISDLPDDAEQPIIMKFDVNAMPVANIAVYGDRSSGDLYQLADDKIRDYFTKIPGVASVDLFGGKIREIQVLADQNNLASHELGLMQVIQALELANMDMPSGRITENRLEYSVRLDGEFESVDEIRNIDLINLSGKSVKLSDVATVVDSFEEQRKIARYDGVESVGLIIKKQGGANTVAIVESVLAEVAALKETLPEDVSLEVVNEKSGFIRSSNEDVIFTMFFGILLTVAVLFIFLHDIRQTIIAAISMPVSIVSTFLLLQMAGFTLNLMSMMALAISVGILVTNSIVVIENIFRHMRHGETVREAAAKGTSEIAVAVFGSTMTNIVVFLPIAFMSGLIGKFFYQFGLTVAFATVVSMFVSFTLTPILSTKFMRKEKKESGWIHAFSTGFNNMFTRLTKGYVAVAGWALGHRVIVLVTITLILVVSMYFGGFLGSEMFGGMDQGEININIEMAPGTAIEQTAQAFDKIEAFIETNYSDLVTATFTKIGTIEGTTTSSEGVYVGTMLLKLVDKSKRSEPIDEIVGRLRSDINFIPGSIITVMLPSPVGGTTADIQLEVSAPSLEELAEYEPKILTALSKIEGAVDVNSSWRYGKPEISVTPDRQKVKDFGLNVQSIAYILRGAIEGIESGEYREDDNTYEIKVKLDESQRSTLEQIDQISIPISAEHSIPLSEVANIKSVSGPIQVYRFGKQKTIEFSANAAGRSMGAVVNDVNAAIRDLNLPSGFSTAYTGTVKMMGESFAELGSALLLAIALTYLVLAAILESFVQPITIMMTLPLALIGVIFALLFTGNPMNIFSMLAVIMLVGIVVNNGILIIEYTTVLRNQGMSRTEALLESCRVKLRPIVMTTLATILGMLPLALSNGMGAELRVPMGIVTIGGLAVSAVMTLIVIPVLYTLIDDIGKKKQASTASE